MKKQVMTAALSAALLLGSVSAVGTSFAADSQGSFTDIGNSYAKDAILQLQEAGILAGIDATHFDPKGELTRAQFVTLIVKALGLPVDETKTSSDTFGDVKGWSAPYIDAAFKAGLIKGLSATEFGPNATVTREQAAVILVHALSTIVELDAKGAELTFKDADQISDWAKDDVALALKYGLISGNADGTFNPKGTTNREQAAVMGANFVKTSDTVKNTDPTTPTTDPTTDPTTPTTDPTTPTTDPTAPTVTPDTTPPAKPADLSAKAIAPTSVTLTWTASRGTKTYYVYQDGVNIGTSTTTSFTATGLAADTNYSFTVKAKDSSGNLSGNSTAVAVNTGSDFLTIGSEDILNAEKGVEFTLPATVQGVVDEDYLDAKIVLQAEVVGDITSADISIADIEGAGTPRTVPSASGSTIYRWGPTGGFTLGDYEQAYANGVTTPFPVTVNKAGTYSIKFSVLVVNADESATREIGGGAAMNLTVLGQSEFAITAPDVTDAVTNEEFTNDVTVKGNVIAAERDNLVRIYATIDGGLTADDVSFQTIPGAGQPEVVSEEGEALKFAWGPSEGFPLSVNEQGYESVDGLLTSFPTTIKVAGTYTIHYSIETLDGAVLGTGTNTVTVTDAPEEEEVPPVG